mgnify:CR=1 FL=1
MGKAAAAAKEAIDKIEGSSYYGLYYSDEPDNGYRNYMELFLPSKKWNKEYIFARNQGTGYSDNIHQEKCMAATVWEAGAVFVLPRNWLMPMKWLMAQHRLSDIMQMEHL